MPTPQNDDLLKEVLQLAHQAAKSSNYVDDVTISDLNGMLGHAVSRAAYPQRVGKMVQGAKAIVSRSGQPDVAQQPVDVYKNLEEDFQAISKSISGMGEDKTHGLSRLIGLDSIVLNGITNAAYAHQNDTAEKQIESFLRERLDKGGDAAVKDLSEGLDKIVISLVHTMHPTIYHSAEARRFESRLTRLLEDKENVSSAGGRLALTDAGREAVSGLFNEKMLEGKAADKSVGFIQRLGKDKATLTPHHPTTVSSETQTEKENFAAIREELAEVVSAWNAAAKKLGHADTLTITPERAQKMIELRTWGRSSDADGREKSTSTFLHESIESGIKDGHYQGEILDLRQNASVHRDLVSSLIQVKFRNSDTGRYGENAESADAFHKFCASFMAHEGQARQEKGPRWDGPKHSIFQQLSSENREAFIAEILKRGDSLVPRSYMKNVKAFMDVIPAAKAKFLDAYKDQIAAAGYDPKTIEYSQMINVTIPHDPGKPNGEKVSLRGAWDAVVKRNGWELQTGGLGWAKTMPHAAPGEAHEFWKDTTPEEIGSQNLLQGTYKLVGKKRQDGSTSWTQSQLTVEERTTLADTVKRMVTINNAIDTYKDDKVATRYQIANFSEAADFLITLKLFQETGLAEIENGVVKKTKLGIMPLLETREDLIASEKIFSNLLKNQTARSFWKERGKAEIMLGFSDGAASSGNFASQWAIYKASRKLVEMFAHEGIEVEFLQGRGRGSDRGGTIDPSLQARLMPPEVTSSGRYDATIQSDLPMDLAASKSYGRDYLTKLLLSTVDAYSSETGKQTRAKLKKMKGTADTLSTDDPVEAVIQKIADKASEVYNDKVRNSDAEGALQFFNRSPDNPYRSSRATARGGVTVYQEFDKVRAIPKEYLFNGADLPAHNVGLAEALQEQVKNPADSAKLMEAMKHPFMPAMLQTISSGMNHFDPAVARAHGRITQSEKFTDTITKDLQPLPGMISWLTKTNKALPGSKNPEMQKMDTVTPDANPPALLNGYATARAFDHMAHGILVSTIERTGQPKPKITLPSEKRAADTIYNALFVTAQEVGHKQLQPMQRESELSR